MRRAVNTPDRHGRTALWQGGMEPNIPVGSAAGVDERHGPRGRRRGARTQPPAPAASGWRTGRWCTSCGRCGSRPARPTSAAARFPPLTYTDDDAAGLRALEPAPRTVRGARDLLSVAIQYGNAFGQGMQAAALKPADFFGERRRALPDGGHGHGRDSREHPVGVAAQAGAVHRRRRGRRRARGRHADAGAVRAAARRGVREAAGRRQSRRARRLEARRRCRLPATSSRRS